MRTPKHCNIFAIPFRYYLTTAYNIQGWITSQTARHGNSTLFTHNLRYYNPSKGTAAVYNGNISEWSAQHGTNQMSTYGFTYDNLGRLTGSINYLDYGARMYEPLTGRWGTVDPMVSKIPNWSPYVYCNNNPISMVDTDGMEPIKPFIGTIEGFVKFMNGLSTGIGLSTGTVARAAMLRMGMTNGIKPANTAPFNTSGNNRYIYTNSGFASMSPETQMQLLKQAGMSPVGEAVQDGYLQEFGDKFTAPHSAYSYEDLPSDKFGADFGANYFDPNSKQTFSEQIQNYIDNVLKATAPQNAPNYNSLPYKYPAKPTRINKTTKPVYVNETHKYNAND